MNNLRLDYFIDESIPIYQHPDHFHINTDTRLLAQFTTIKENETVLDIGCNNAALLLYFDRFKIKKLYGVEILQESYKIAQINAKSFIKHDCELFNCPVQELSIEKVDVIVSNPPYFKIEDTHPNTKMTYRQLGRIEKNLTLDELFQNVDRLLKKNGRFYMVHRPDRLNEIYATILKYNFQIKSLQIAYDKNSQIEKSLLVECVRTNNCKCKILPPLSI